MITIAEHQAEVYELVLTGINDIEILMNKTRRSKWTIYEILRALHKNKMIEKKNKKSPYSALKVEYKVRSTREPNKVVSIYNADMEDKLVTSLMNFKPTPEQVRIMHEHKGERRSILAKLTGLTKLQVNFTLWKEA
jgi:predicted transcriptional regulator